MMRQLVAFLLLVFSAAAQTEPPAAPAGPVALVYEGKPLQVPVACTEEDIQSLGMSCSADSPCPVYLELSGLEVLGARMNLAGNLHTDSATLSSIVLTSEDSGRTWTESHPRIRQAALDQMQFIDLATGWISGQVIASLPRDPFFLVTNDGGKTWRQRAVFSDPHLGSIEKFHFTSANEGRVLVDRAQSGEGGRYALLESKTGGDSWSIQQITTAPPPVKFERAPSAAWRLQANGATKAHQLERREGGKWVTVAAFRVQAGSCAPAEIQLAPPPEPTVTPAAGAAATDAVEVFQIGGGKPAKKPDPKKKKR